MTASLGLVVVTASVSPLLGASRVLAWVSNQFPRVSFPEFSSEKSSLSGPGPFPNSSNSTYPDTTPLGQ